MTWQKEKVSIGVSGYTNASDNSLILHIYIIIRKYNHTYFELIHAFYIWFLNNVK